MTLSWELPHLGQRMMGVEGVTYAFNGKGGMVLA
jgi:hypothetical protein